jgi:hypothetical protein
VSFDRFKNTKTEQTERDLINKTIETFLRLHEKLHNWFCFLSIHKPTHKYGPQTPKICVFHTISLHNYALSLWKQICSTSFWSPQTIVIISSVILFLIYGIPVPPIAQKPFALFRKLWLVLSFTRKAEYQSQHSLINNIHLMSPVLCTKYFRRSSTCYIQTIILYILLQTWKHSKKILVLPTRLSCV